MDAFYVFNIGEIALEQGRLDEAEEAFVAVAGRGERPATGPVPPTPRGSWPASTAEQGRFDDALELFASCIEEMEDIGSRADALEATSRMAECLLLSGDFAGALALAERCLALAQDLGGVPPQIPLIYRVRGAALARAGEPVAGTARPSN